MNEQLATAPASELIDPQTARESAAFELLQRQAKMLASSTLIPKEFQGNVANCGIAINMARRLQADPFMVCQNVDVIHGRPSLRASFLIAMVNAAGRFAPLQFRMEGTEGTEGKPDRSCIAWTKSKADGALLEGPKITLEMAKSEGWSTKAGSKWVTMPELMLRYRAAAFFARLYAPDITLGMHTAEELHDAGPTRDVTPAKAEPLTPAPQAKDEPPPTIEAELAPERQAEPEPNPMDDPALVDFLDMIDGAADGAALTQLVQPCADGFRGHAQDIAKKAIAKKAKALGVAWSKMERAFI